MDEPTISILIKGIASWILEMTRTHGMIVSLLAVIGAFAIITAIGEKVFRAIQYLFMFFFALPAIFVVGLINKKNRKQRLKELGDIKAHIINHPEKWKRMLYYFLRFLFVTLIMVFVVIFGVIIFFILQRTLMPVYQLNQASQSWLQNSTNVTVG